MELGCQGCSWCRNMNWGGRVSIVLGVCRLVGFDTDLDLAGVFPLDMGFDVIVDAVEELCGELGGGLAG